MKTIKKRFYVGSRSMHPDGNRYNDWAHDSLEKAIKHAKEVAEENEEDQIVVEIVRVVERKKVPLIVRKP